MAIIGTEVCLRSLRESGCAGDGPVRVGADPACVAQLQTRVVAAEALERTIPEPGTLHYDWFFSEDETKCVVREIYADSDAMLAHLGNVDDLLGRLIELGGGLEPEGFGRLSAELAEAIAPFNPTLYAHFQGK